MKRILEIALVRSGIAQIAARWNSARVIVLAYHNIVPEGRNPTGERSLHLPQRQFARQLDQLQEHFDVVPLESLLQVEPVPGSRARAVITFDDAYRGAVTAGVEELVHRELPATIFVAPTLFGDQACWWDTLADPATGSVDAGLRLRALAESRGRAQLVGRWPESTGKRGEHLPAHARTATEAELQRALELGQITLGSHTWSHPNLRRVTEEELREELERSLRWLEARFPQTVPWLAYPYGLAGPAVEAAAQRAGYVGAFLVDGGLLPRNRMEWRLHALPRVNVPAGLSDEGFALRVSGLLAH